MGKGKREGGGKGEKGGREGGEGGRGRRNCLLGSQGLKTLQPRRASSCDRSSKISLQGLPQALPGPPKNVE